MTSSAIAPPLRPPQIDIPSSSLLNGFEITNRAGLAWDVCLYRLTPRNRGIALHGERGALKDAFWSILKKHRKPNWGYGFVVDLNEGTVAVPAAWDIPSGVIDGGYEVQIERTCVATAADPISAAIVEAIIREGIKKRLKESNHRSLGPLWQDYRDFSQMPERGHAHSDCVFIRRFRVVPHLLRGGIWALNIQIRTGTLDTRTLADYYARGEADVLAARITAKRANRLTRRNEATAIRTWADNPNFGPRGQVFEIDDPSTIIAHGTLPRHEQRNLATGTVRCRRFGRGTAELPLKDIRLILDTQITQEEHRETIISPSERYRLTGLVRDLLDGTDIYGCTLSVAKTPIIADGFPSGIVTPPAIRVRDRDSGHAVIPAPDSNVEDAFRQRGFRRASHLRRNGFLEERPIHPLLACPGFFGPARSKRMLTDLNYALKTMNIGYRFSRYELYDDVHRLAQILRDSEYDALLAVLPEDGAGGLSDTDTHEQIKRLIELPSQCIRHSNTLPTSWVDKPWHEFQSQQRELARRVQHRYALCVHNLLIKHHWVPFAPAEPSYFNVQVGLDVGGRHNTHVMTCLGYGFANPAEGLLFLPEEIVIDTQQREPIPTNHLYNGLLRLISKAHAALEQAAMPVNLERVVFYRDGAFFGHGDNWNELDALTRLHATLLDRKWISADAVWIGVEVMKAAEGWRVFGSGQGITNPLVGFWARPFEDENTGLVCTTGRPYLHQGTARPLKLRLRPIAGSVSWDTVVRDVVWQADLGLTKPDMGVALPWVLHVADVGALQSSRAYKVSGITV